MESTTQDISGVNIPSSQSSSTQNVKGICFAMMWDDPAIHLQQNDGSLSIKKSDFALKLSAMVEAGDNTGFLANVKRAIDGQQKSCFFTTESTSHRARFMSQINSSFGSGGMTLALNDVQFSALIQHLKDEQRSLPIKKAACTIGLQPCGKIWVFAGDVQMDNDGEILGTDSPYVLGNSLIGQMCNVPSEDIHPKINLPLTTSPMRQLLEALSVVMKHNFIQSILILAGGVMALHYRQVIQVNSGCPAIIAAGPSETGKSTSIKCALSLTGARNSTYVKGSNAFFMERASLSSLPFAIDDPPKAGGRGGGFDISDLIVDLYNGCKTANLKAGSLRPLSTAIIATNFELRNEPRVKTRAIVVDFKLPTVTPDDDDEEDAFSTIEDLCSNSCVSSAIGWAVSVGKDLSDKREIIRGFSDRVKTHFTGRMAKNWGTLLYFVHKLLQEGGMDLSISIPTIVEQVKGETIHTTQVAVEEILHKTLEEVLKSIQGKSLFEVLQYVRYGVTVEKRAVVAVVLGDIQKYLTYPVLEIRKALEGKWGRMVKKDFLKCGATDTIIQRSKNDRKRPCFAFFSEYIPEEILCEFQRATSRSSSSKGSAMEIESIEDPEPSTHDDPEPTTHDDPEPSTHDDPEPTTHDDPEPSTHDDPEPSMHDDPEPSMHDEPSTHDDPEPSMYDEPSMHDDPEPNTHDDPEESLEGPEANKHDDPEPSKTSDEDTEHTKISHADPEPKKSCDEGFQMSNMSESDAHSNQGSSMSKRPKRAKRQRELLYHDITFNKKKK